MPNDSPAPPVTLSPQEWEAVVNAIGQYPYNQVHGLIGKIATQLKGEAK